VVSAAFSPLKEDSNIFYTESDKHSIFTRLKEQDPELYHKYSMLKKEQRVTYGNTLRQHDNIGQEQVNEISESLAHYKSMGFSRYGILIILSWSFPSRICYVKMWDMINSLKHD
jgi:hypothetical protein